MTGLQTRKSILLARVTRGESTEVGTREPASEGDGESQETGSALRDVSGKEGTT